MNFTTTDIVGYLGSAMILISFLMKKMNMLRIINTVGCVLLIVYGIMLSFKWPIIITNFGIVIINIYYLNKGKKS